MRYDSDALIKTYIEKRRYDRLLRESQPECGAVTATAGDVQEHLALLRRFEGYYSGLLMKLEESFGIPLSREANEHMRLDGMDHGKGLLLWFFQMTVDSYLNIRILFGEPGDAGRLFRRLSERGEPGRRAEDRFLEIQRLADEARAKHLKLLRDLFECIYGKVEHVVTSEDLLAMGFDDSEEPDPSDLD